MPPKSSSERKLHLKDIATIVAILSFVGGLYLWGNSQVIIPNVLEETRQQTQQAVDESRRQTRELINETRRQSRERIEKHESGIHNGSFSQREFKLWSEQVLKRLEAIERAVTR